MDGPGAGTRTTTDTTIRSASHSKDQVLILDLELDEKNWALFDLQFLPAALALAHVGLDLKKPLSRPKIKARNG